MVITCEKIKPSSIGYAELKFREIRSSYKSARRPSEKSEQSVVIIKCAPAIREIRSSRFEKESTAAGRKLESIYYLCQQNNPINSRTL